MLGSRCIFVILIMAIARSPSSGRVTTTFAFVMSPSKESRQNSNHPSMIHNGAFSCKSPSAYAPPITTWSCRNNHNNKNDAVGKSCLHSSVVSPRRADVGRGIDDDNIDDADADCERENLEEDLRTQQEQLSELFNLLHAEPQDLLRFETEDSSGVRGLYLNRSVKSGEIVLKIPLDSLLTDDESPSWLDDGVKNDPRRWATRLAASWIELHLKDQQLDNDDDDDDDATTTNNNNNNIDSSFQEGSYKGHRVWSALLPDPEYLRASLPVHWPETTVLNARSTALELAVDSAYFARAEAVNDLVHGMQGCSHYLDMFSSNNNNRDDDNEDDEVAVQKRMHQLAHHALDLVQTRSCRLEDEDGASDSRRALAPIFDFINHGSRNTASANAYFALEREQEQQQVPPSDIKREFLVVRSMQDISQDEEVTMDYGASARPAWKCLLSYGFVPEYKRTTTDAESGGENLAEVYMKGVRYEVADDSVPIDMVADATPTPWVDEDDSDDPESNKNIALTPDIALRIGERIADAAFYLLLEPEQILDEHDESEDDPENANPPTPFEVISKQLAASLRWSQHRILLTCAAGLTHFAKEHTTKEEQEESSYQ